ncbi:MAG: hypothetical protein M1834_005104 [Cirrosporium novae-zelandiae]|nr:MAG: hypothetical protein M1834_005104 [Cirrosporium novae-zelandiae]
MQPTPGAYDPTRENRSQNFHQRSQGQNMINRTAADPARGRSDDSWVEVSSRPSSSSLSSAYTDEIVTTGLTVQHDSNARRKRRPRNNIQARRRRHSFTSSSQEEYDESESESDRVLTSSTEGLLSRNGASPTLALSPPSDDGSYEEDDEDDDGSTALGIRSPTPAAFTPQPNAFSHPPSSQTQRAVSSAPGSQLNLPTSRQTTTVQQHHQRAGSYPPRQQHTPYNIIAPNHQVDHDAALRASLSTLLSCAAAARGLPKSAQPQSSRMNVPGSNRIEPTTLQMVPESVLLGEEPSTRRKPSLKNTPSTSSVPSSHLSRNSDDKHKRKASSSKDRSRASKKTRRGVLLGSDVAETVSPTLMTWILSAGVVVLFSAISFSAGYVMGKEVGKAEAEAMGLGGAADGGVSCGRDSVRRLRFGNGRGVAGVVG